jgi:hypothetical protein
VIWSRLKSENTLVILIDYNISTSLEAASTVCSHNLDYSLFRLMREVEVLSLSLPQVALPI